MKLFGIRLDILFCAFLWGVVLAGIPLTTREVFSNTGFYAALMGWLAFSLIVTLKVAKTIWSQYEAGDSPVEESGSTVLLAASLACILFSAIDVAVSAWAGEKVSEPILSLLGYGFAITIATAYLAWDYSRKARQVGEASKASTANVVREMSFIHGESFISVAFSPERGLDVKILPATQAMP